MEQIIDQEESDEKDKKDDHFADDGYVVCVHAGLDSVGTS